MLYLFVLQKQLDAKSGNLRSSDVKDDKVEKKKKLTSGWIPYYLPPQGEETTPISLLASLPEKTTFRKSANMRKDVKEEEEGEENLSSLMQSGEESDVDFQFELQIVEGADDSTDAQMEGGFSQANSVHTRVETGEVDDSQRGDAVLEQAQGHTAEHAAELVAEWVGQPVTAPASGEPRAEDDKNEEAPEEAQPLPVQETNEVSVEEGQEETPSVAKKAVHESAPSQPADVSESSQPEDVSVPNQSTDATVPELNESNGSEVDTAEGASAKENFYHSEEHEEEEEEKQEQMEDEEFENDYDNVMHEGNDHEGETSSNDGPTYLTIGDTVTMLAVRNLLSAFNYDYAVMDFLTSFNPDVISAFYVV